MRLSSLEVVELAHGTLDVHSTEGGRAGRLDGMRRGAGGGLRARRVREAEEGDAQGDGEEGLRLRRLGAGGGGPLGGRGRP